uniref:Transcriptional adapter n=2 Tax=Anthurium amnicola TaxID=1678845 RepID=A0A1D1XW14_9ARAE
MGRSRGVTNTAGDEDPSQRSKRRRNASSGETLENVATGTGTSDGKKALYHCNYCNKDISGKIRIKCTKCPDFDLCVECFTVGAEVHPHKSNHPYRVMDSLSFPLFCPEWNADEEILLLEGIEMYGLGNWAEVSEHVGTKSKGQCIDHYTTYYLNSPCYPLPNMAHVVGKNRKELLAMAKGHGDGKKGFPSAGETTPKEESPFSPSRVKLEDLSRETPTRQSPSSLVADGDSVDVKISIQCNSTSASSAGANKKASNMMHIKEGSDRIKVEGLTSSEECQVDRSVGIKKPKYSGEDGPSITELSGYNPKRQEFDPEYDNDAELSLSEMEFKETDSETDRELKLRVLRIYNSRLDERKRRKDFILERNLLYPSTFEKGLSGEDREICERYKVFMRFHSQEEHEELIWTLIEERKIRKRIQELLESRDAGCRTRVEADAYLAEKAKKELENSGHKARDSSQVAASNKVLQRTNRPVNREKGEYDGSPRHSVDNQKAKVGGGLDTCGREFTSGSTGQANVKPIEEWDIAGLPGADLLSESDQQLCRESRLLPSHFLKMQQVLVTEIFKGNIQQKGDAQSLFKVDPSIVDKIYSVVTKKLSK